MNDKNIQLIIDNLNKASAVKSAKQLREICQECHDLLKKEQEHQPHVTAEVILVPYGYQLDIYDRTKDEKHPQPVHHAMECHDFGGDYSLSKLGLYTTVAFIQAMHDLEKNHLR